MPASKASVSPRWPTTCRCSSSGLDSLCIAILVANLEDELELDPFAAGDEVAIPVTLGDFIRLYENAAA